MGPTEMEEVAKLYGRVLLKGEDALPHGEEIGCRAQRRIQPLILLQRR